MVLQPYDGITDKVSHRIASGLTAGEAGGMGVCTGELTVRLPGS